MSFVTFLKPTVSLSTSFSNRTAQRASSPGSATISLAGATSSSGAGASPSLSSARVTGSSSLRCVTPSLPSRLRASTASVQTPSSSSPLAGRGARITEKQARSLSQMAYPAPGQFRSFSSRLQASSSLPLASEVAGPTSVHDTAPVVSSMRFRPINTRIHCSAMTILGDYRLFSLCESYLTDGEKHRLTRVNSTIKAHRDRSLIDQLSTTAKIRSTDYSAYQRRLSFSKGNFTFLASCTDRIQEVVFDHRPGSLYALDFFHTLHALPVKALSSLTTITCSDLTEDMIQAIDKTCAQLNAITITGPSCQCLESLISLVDRRRQSIALACPSATQFTCDILSETIVRICDQAFPKITHITCKEMTEEAVDRILLFSVLPRIESLIIKDRLSIQSHVYRHLQELARSRPHVHIQFKAFDDGEVFDYVSKKDIQHFYLSAERY